MSFIQALGCLDRSTRISRSVWTRARPARRLGTAEWLFKVAPKRAALHSSYAVQYVTPESTKRVKQDATEQKSAYWRQLGLVGLVALLTVKRILTTCRLQITLCLYYDTWTHPPFSNTFVGRTYARPVRWPSPLSPCHARCYPLTLLFAC